MPSTAYCWGDTAREFSVDGCRSITVRLDLVALGVIMRSVLASVALLVCIASEAEALCGSRGGPAFRKPDGKCASWKEIEADACGTPPTTRCTLEGGGIGATSIAKARDFIADRMPGSATALAPTGATAAAMPGEFNRRSIRADGIACASQNTVASAASCLVGRGQTDCRAAVEQSIAKGECAKVTAGTEARIEAGSHSFDWVRVRIGNRPAPLWVERRLVLE